MKSYLLFGSRLALDLKDYLSLELKGDIIGISPLSNEPLYKDFEYICRTGPDYLVIDLYTCIHFLYEVDNKLVTYTGKESLSENIDKLYSPIDSYTGSMKSNFNTFINSINRFFPGDRIFLIAAAESKYFVIGQQLRKYKKDDDRRKKYKFIKSLEKKFIEETGAQYISLSKYYFNKKIPGYLLNEEIFEAGFYENISYVIDKYLSEGVFEDRLPRFDLSLERYGYYQFRTILHKAFYCFFDREKFTDGMVLSSPREFVIKHKSDFCRLKVIENLTEERNQLYQTIKHDQKLSNDFRNVVLGYCSLMFPEEDRPQNNDCIMAFREKVVPASLLHAVRAYHASAGISPKVINSNNAGYYYAMMRGKTHLEALGYVKSDTVITPTLVDVYGSCVSNTCLNERITGNHGLARNNYFFHVPLYESSSIPVEYPGGVFEGDIDVKDKNTKMQFDHTIENAILDSDSDWVVIDLYSFIAPKTYLYGDFIYTDLNGKISIKLASNKIDICKNFDLLGDKEALKRRIMTCCSWIKKRWNDNIILIDIQASALQIGDDDVIYEPRIKKNIKLRETILGDAFRFISKLLNCYTISITHDFIADDKGYLARVLVHYEFDFYDVMIQIIKKIIDQKPEKKFYDTYPNEIRVKRILRLLPQNNIKLLRRYFSNGLDEVVLQLPIELIEKYNQFIVDWYDRGIGSKRELINKVDFTDYEDLKRAIEMTGNVETEDSVKIPKDYAAWPEWKVPKEINVVPKEVYYIEYDGNGAEKGAMKKSVIEYGIKKHLRKNTFEKEGYQFIGWKAYRQSDGKTSYWNGKNKKFFIEGKQKEGFDVFLYPERAVVAKQTAVRNDTILMIAQWASL